MSDPDNITGKYIIKDGFAVQCYDLMEWAQWMVTERENFHYTDHVHGIRISTVFLGLDHAFGGDEPVLWETMVFNDEAEDFMDLDQWRCGITPAEAKDFHDSIVRKYREQYENSSVTLRETDNTSTET